MMVFINVGPSRYAITTVIAYRAGVSASGVTATQVVNNPGVLDGDVLLATVQTDGTTPVAPTGWALQQNANTPTGAAPCYLYSRVAASEPGTWTFGHAGGSYCAVIVDAWSGVDNTTPMDVAATVGTGTGATVTFPNITTATNKAWHYVSWADDGAGTGSSPSAYSVRTVLVAGGMSGYDKQITPAGLVTGVTKTGGTSWVAFSAALRPFTEGGLGDPQIQWSAHMETGNLSEWNGEDPSGSAASTAVTAASQGIAAHGGSWVMKQSVTGTGATRMNVYLGLNALCQAGTTFWATWWHYFPSAITFPVSDSYQIWQIASQSSDLVFSPIWVLAVNQTSFSFSLVWSADNHAPANGPHSGETGKRIYPSAIAIPTAQWVKFEIMVTPAGKTDTDFTGALKVIMNNQVLFDLTSIKTRFPDVGAGGLMYTTHNAYGSNLSPNPAVQYVDDVTYSLGRMP